MGLSRIPPHTVMGTILRAPLSLLPKGTVMPILKGPLAGKRWIVGSATHGCWLGSYEHHKQRLFAQSVRDGFVVFDVGAHVGFYTLLAANAAGRTGRIFAFEPLPRNLGFLRRHLDLNAVRTVTVIAAAVSDASGRTRFEERESPSMGRLAAEGTLTVETVTLDDMVFRHGIPPPDVIKMDIEGGELAALAGAAEVIRTHHPLIFLATHSQALHGGCLSLLRRNGYALEPIDAPDVMETDEVVARFDPTRRAQHAVEDERRS